MAAEFSPKIVDAISAAAAERGLTALFDEEEGCFQVIFRSNSALRRIDTVIDVRDSLYLVYSYFGIRADEEYRDQAAELLMHLNRREFLGSFEMNMKTGEIRYKCAVDCRGFIPTSGMISKSIILPPAVMDEYAREIIRVMFGMESAEAAIDGLPEI